MQQQEEAFHAVDVDVDDPTAQLILLEVQRLEQERMLHLEPCAMNRPYRCLRYFEILDFPFPIYMLQIPTFLFSWKNKIVPGTARSFFSFEGEGRGRNIYNSLYIFTESVYSSKLQCTWHLLEFSLVPY